MIVLALNSGSNSLKFQIVSVQPGQSVPTDKEGFGEVILSGVYDNIGKPDGEFTLFKSKHKEAQEHIETRSYGHATELLLDWLSAGNASAHGVRSLHDIERVGHRVVHGGSYFDAPARITRQVTEQIEALQDLAPLHNASSLQVIHAAQKRLGDDFPMFAVFDTTFHRSIPQEAALYALPPDIASRHRIRRY